jgi:signal transduction histidine kinase
MSALSAGSLDSARAAATLTAWGALNALDALDVGVLLLGPDLRVLFANARWAGWHGGDVLAGTPVSVLMDETDVLDAVRATLADGESRPLTLTLRPARADTGVRRVYGCVRRGTSGVVLEARAESDDDRMALQDVARRLAEVNDMAEVLRTLCDIATRQCSATGAAVLRLTASVAEVVAASGGLLPARGRCFESHGSLLEESIVRDEVVAEEHFSESGRPLMRAMPELTLGPVLAAPLRAHGDALGVLAVTRAVGDQPFSQGERERLRVLADHAALAVHKSLLLQRAQSADRAKGRFLATMSHELRTPLTALAGYGELLADEVIGPLSETQLDVLERMRSVTTHLSAMIEEILAFTSLEEGRETVRPSDFLAEDLVRAAIAAVEPLAEQKSLVVNLVLPQRATSARQRREVHRSGDGAGDDVEHPARAPHRDRGYGHRDPDRRAATSVPSVRAGGHRPHPPARGHRAGPLYLTPPRDHARRPYRGRERAGSGVEVLCGAAVGGEELAGNGRAASGSPPAGPVRRFAVRPSVPLNYAHELSPDDHGLQRWLHRRDLRGISARSGVGG